MSDPIPSAGTTHQLFTLYVSGIGPASRRALANFTAFRKQHLAGRSRCKVVDIVAHPAAAHDDNIVAIPTLIRHWPLPRQIFVGDLSDTTALCSLLTSEAPWT